MSSEIPPFPETPEPAPTTQEERTMAVVCHVLGIVGAFFLCGAFVGPLVIYLVKGKESVFIAHHAYYSMIGGLALFAVNAIIAILGFLLSCIFVGPLLWLLIPVVSLVYLGMCVWGIILGVDGKTFPF